MTSNAAQVLVDAVHPHVDPDLRSPVPGTGAEGVEGESRARRKTRDNELMGQVQRLLARMRIAVIYGGNKDDEGSVLYRTHNPRSWKSYEAVASDIADSLRRLGCRHVSLMADDMRLADRLREDNIQFAWLNTGGVQGYCAVSHAPAIMEMLGVPYVGHEPLTAGILDSKHTFKRQLKSFGIPTAKFVTWHAMRGPLNPLCDFDFRLEFGEYKGPYVVKPVSGRASLNVEYVERTEDIPEVAERIFELTQSHVLIEEFLSGREYCVAACGPLIARNGELTRLDGPFTFALVERVLQPDEHIFTSMDKRPITGDRVRPLDPVADEPEIHALHALARQVFVDLNIETLVRLDVRANAEGRLNVLEANPKPDLKAPVEGGVTSLIAEGLAECGMSYDDLILSLIADRLDLVLMQRRGSADHLQALLTNCEA